MPSASAPSHRSSTRGSTDMKSIKLPATQQEMDLFLNDVFKTVFTRLKIEEDKQQIQLALEGGKPNLRAVPTETE